MLASRVTSARRAGSPRATPHSRRDAARARPGRRRRRSGRHRRTRPEQPARPPAAGRIPILLGFPSTQVKSKIVSKTCGRRTRLHPAAIHVLQPRPRRQFVRQLYSGMDSTLYRDNRLALDWLGSGKYSIAFYVQKSKKPSSKDCRSQQFKQAMKEGVGLSSRVGHMALINPRRIQRRESLYQLVLVPRRPRVISKTPDRRP